MEKVLSVLLKNTPVAFFVIGLFLVVLGASGGYEKFGLKIDSTAWRALLAFLGFVAAVFGGLLVWRGTDDVDIKRLAKECDPKITSHRNGDSVDENIQLRGTYSQKPPDDALAVLELSTTTRKYYFKNAPLLDEATKEWFADIKVRGNPGSERILYVALLGAPGRALQKYFFSVPDQTKGWAGIETLTPDIVRHHSVTVRRKVSP